MVGNMYKMRLALSISKMLITECVKYKDLYDDDIASRRMFIKCKSCFIVRRCYHGIYY